MDLPRRDHRLLIVSVASCQWREPMSQAVEMARRWRMTSGGGGGGGGGGHLTCLWERWGKNAKGWICNFKNVN